MITTLAFGGYRSLRDLVLAVGPLTAITGGGTGKSNVYRALRLLVDAAEGQLARALAREGGMVKEETIRTLAKKRVSLLECRNVSAMLRDEEGRPVTFSARIEGHESVSSS